MNCDNCGNEITDYAICSDCEIELRRSTKIELSGKDLLKALKNLVSQLELKRTSRENEIIYFALSRLLDQTTDHNEFSELDKLRDKFKPLNNLLNQKNPSEQDEYKSSL